MELINGKNLKTYFEVKNKLGFGKSVVKAVDDVSIIINEGETFGLVGESGCGKSTLGRTLLGMHDLSGGQLMYHQIDMSDPKSKNRALCQQKMQIIFQDPYSSLDPFWNVQEILAEPLTKMNLSKTAKQERIETLLNRVGLNKKDLEKYPYEFSGGQRQRIGIARALTTDPEFIFCDEPIAALDVSIQAQVVNMLEDLQEEFGLTYLFAAHDLSMVRYISDRIGVMYLGKLVEVSEANELYTHPLHPYTKALLSSVPVANPEVAKNKSRIFLQGELPSPLDVPKGCRFAPRCKYAKDICHQQSPELKEYGKDHYVACHLVEEIN